MKSFNIAMIAGACALSVAAMPGSAEAAPKAQSAGNSVGGVSMKDIQEVGRGGWGRGGGRGFSGRGFGGRSWGGYRGGGWRGAGWRGRGWGYRGGRYGYYRGRGWGYGPWVAGAAVAGVAVGAAAASPYYYDDDYYDDGYYAPRRVYRGSECQVISRRHDVDGRPVKVIRYRPC